MNKKLAFFMALLVLILSPVSYIKAADGYINPVVYGDKDEYRIIRADAASGTDTGAATGVDTGAATGVDSGAATDTDTGAATDVDTGSATDTDPEPTEKLTPTLVVENSKIYVPVGGEEDLYADYEGDDEVDLTYKSLDKSIVKVDSEGFVTGVAEGKAKVKISAPETDTYKGVSLKVTVYVTKPYELSLKKKKLELKAKETGKINVKVSDPHDYDIDPELKYTSTNKKIATVSKKGKVTAVSKGSCKINITAADGQKLTVKVTVTWPDTSKMIYLTYDDGPGSVITPKLLDVLKKYDAKATFFLVGNSAKNQKKLVKRQKKEGHTIAIHTNTHDYKKIYASSSAYISDFNAAEKIIKDITGEQPKFWRFPGGGNNSYITSSMQKTIMDKLHKRGYMEFDWTAATNDATGVSYTAQQMIDFGISSINAAIKNKKAPVVLMHDWNGKPHTPEVTEAILKYFTKKGYVFVGLDDYYGEEITFKK